MSKTNIEWSNEVWNPVRGCSRVSEGCRNCYAERIAARYSDPGPFAGFAERHYLYKIGDKKQNWEPRWTGKVELIESKLYEPLHWRKPRRVFVNSMSDLFHENLPFEVIDRVVAVMALTPHITYQVLTKRARRMREYFLREEQEGPFGAYKMVVAAIVERNRELGIMGHYKAPAVWPLQNLWLGVSVENQPTADERIPELLRTPAALRFVSYEPALAEVNWDSWLNYRRVGSGTGKLQYNRATTLDWGIVGGESGPGARPFQLEWAESTVHQFGAAGVPLFVKQLGANPRQGCFKYGCEEDPKKGGNPLDWPRELRVRQFPPTVTALPSVQTGANVVPNP